MQDDLLELLGARRGIVCAVGAGGKKTTLYALTRRHAGRIGVTTTVLLPPFPRELEAARVIAAAPDLSTQVASAAQQHRVIAFAQPSAKPGRIAGVSLELLSDIQTRVRFDLLLVKADGARRRSIKAPAPYEPMIPPQTTTVLALVSAAVFGCPLDERLAHRVELIETITGARRDKPLEPEHIARLLTSEEGLLKGVGDALVVPIINMVDNTARQALAGKAARQALALSDRFDHVILATMNRAQPIVQVIRR